MKESEELSNLLSIINDKQEMKDLCSQIEEFENYVKKNNVGTEKRQLIISQEDLFWVHHRNII